MYHHKLDYESRIMYHELSMNKKYLRKYRFFSSSEKGFTLIELLVVISVIAVLTTLLMANFVGIRQRGRDGQRKSNLFNIQTSLELYRADNGVYPDTDAFPTCGNSLAGDNGATVYMQEVPCEPLDDSDYTYISIDGTTYTLVGCLENENDSDADDDADFQASGCATPASFTLRNP
jgi:general secretion pathway protein G